MSDGIALVCIGLTTLDVVALPIEFHPFEERRLIRTIQMAPAGTAAGTALVAARLGVPTRLLGAVGDDAMGRFVCTELAREGVDVSMVARVGGAATSATLIPIDAAARKAVYHAAGAARKVRIGAEWRDAVREARVVHYAGLGADHLDGGAVVGLLADAKDGGAMITCDLISPGDNAVVELRRILPYVDVFMPSAVEARFLTGESELKPAAELFRQWGAGACVIKNGADGAFALAADGTAASIAAIPVSTVVDTTSCGDSFCAGFIAATLRGRAWIDAIKFAAAAAALVAQGAATLGLLDSFDQVNELLAQEESR